MWGARSFAPLYNPHMEYSGKTALITGASSGLGVEFARLLAERGANVVPVARSEEKLSGLADELQRDRGVRAPEALLVQDRGHEDHFLEAGD